MSYMYGIPLEPYRYLMSSAANVYRHTTNILKIAQHNKLTMFLTLTSSLVYGVVYYFEYHYLEQRYANWREYNNIYSSLAAKYEQLSGQAHVNDSDYTNLFANYTLSIAQTLALRQAAFITWAVFSWLKPMALGIMKESLGYAFKQQLIEKWLGSRNNQCGFRYIDPDIGEKSPEVIEIHSTNYVNGLVDRMSMIADTILAFSKIETITTSSRELIEKGCSLNLLLFTSCSALVHFGVSFAINSFLKDYNSKDLQSQIKFRSKLTSNKQAAVQIEALNATSKEAEALKESVYDVTHNNAKILVAKSTLSTFNITFTSWFDMSILSHATADILKNPPIYFSLQKIIDFSAQASVSITSIFDKYTSTHSWSKASQSIDNFTKTIDSYQGLLEKAEAQFPRNTSENDLSVDLTIEYEKNKRWPNGFSVSIKKTFPRGVITAVTGENGSGKTSFFDAIRGTNPCIQSNIALPDKKRIIYVNQQSHYIADMNWLDNIFYPLEQNVYNGFFSKSSTLKKKIENDWPELLGIKSLTNLDKLGSNLSPGEVQKLAIIRTLAKIHTFEFEKNSNPENIILLLDEVTSALNAKAKKIVIDLLKNEVKEKKITALHIDHSDRATLEDNYGSNNIVVFSKPRSESEEKEIILSDGQRENQTPTLYQRKVKAQNNSSHRSRY